MIHDTLPETRHTPAAGRRQPGPKPRISRDAIVDAAIETGLGAVTMRSVARRLAVSAPALYRYFVSRDDIVLAALEELLRRSPPPSGDGWRAVLEAEADLRWQLLTTYHGLVDLDPGRVATATHERTLLLIDALVAEGIGDVADAVFAIDAVLDTVQDGAAQAGRLRVEPDGPLSDELAGRMDRCPPEVRAALQQIVDDPAAHVRRKVDLMLDGIEARVAERNQA